MNMTHSAIKCSGCLVSSESSITHSTSSAHQRVRVRSFSKPGFTLTEILVTITIILVLAGTLFAITRNLKRSGENVVAIGRIQSLAQANAAYAVENSGKYVPVFAFADDRSFKPAWFYNKEFLEPITGNTGFLDNPVQYEGNDGYPESVLDPVVVRSKKHYWSRLSASFGYNQENMPGGEWGDANTNRSHTIYSVTSPNRTFQFITATDWTAKYSGRNLWKNAPVEGRTTNGKIAFRHKGDKALAVFYDGHVESISQEDIKNFDQRGGVNHAFWGGSRQ